MKQLENCYDANDLDELRALRMAEIDAKTEELISEGFTYQSKLFSLSLNSQINISALNQSRTELSYPITYNTKDDMDAYSVTDATDMNNMYMTALSVKKAHLDSGSSLKQQIRDAADIAAVNAVIDNR